MSRIYCHRLMRGCATLRICTCVRRSRLRQFRTGRGQVGTTLWYLSLGDCDGDGRRGGMTSELIELLVVTCVSMTKYIANHGADISDAKAQCYFMVKRRETPICPLLRRTTRTASSNPIVHDRKQKPFPAIIRSFAGLDTHSSYFPPTCPSIKPSACSLLTTSIVLALLSKLTP